MSYFETLYIIKTCFTHCKFVFRIVQFSIRYKYMTLVYSAQSMSDSDEAESVLISLEAPVGDEIIEIAYDGSETNKRELDLSEDIAVKIAKIDFSKVAEDDNKMEDSEDTAEGNEEASVLVSSSENSQWAPIAAKIRNALTEVSVLLDVINVCKEKRYMALDPVAKEKEEVNPMAMIYSRKEGLAKAGSMLLVNAERLQANQSDNTAPNFIRELLELRKNYRLKKTANDIIGDLNFKPGGSKYPHGTTFVVTEVDDSEVMNGVHNTASPMSALRVTIPSELRGVAYLMVFLQEGNDDLFEANINWSTWFNPTISDNQHWKEILEGAQNVLFCQELFSQLAQEANKVQSFVSTSVVSGQIVSNIFPNIRLVIKLFHKKDNDDMLTKENGIDGTKILERCFVLEHALHELLHEMRESVKRLPYPHPTTAPLYWSKEKHLAATSGANRADIAQMSSSTTILEQILRQSQHLVTKARTMRVLNSIHSEIYYPQISIEWLLQHSLTVSCMIVRMTSQDCIPPFSTSVVIKISETSLEITTDDGRVFHASYDFEELHHILQVETIIHQLRGIAEVAKYLNWNLMNSRESLFYILPTEPKKIGLQSPSGDRAISIEFYYHGNIIVNAGYCPDGGQSDNNIISKNVILTFSSFEWKEVAWNKMAGKGLLEKLKFLIISLST